MATEARNSAATNAGNAASGPMSASDRRSTEVEAMKTGAAKWPYSLDAFVRESNRIENIHREPSSGEVSATAGFLSRKTLTISDFVDLVKVYQPDARPRFVQGLDVRVGDHYPIRGGPAVQASLQELLDGINAGRRSDPYKGHVDYETLHPFTDGNGRSGRALWLWLMGGMIQAPLGFLHHFYYQALQNAR